jgi:uracil-DNA glycosylase
VKVVIALGKIAFDSFLMAYRENGRVVPTPRPPFKHGSLIALPDGTKLVASYHPSQQNTFTGKLTRHMFNEVFQTAKAEMGSCRPQSLAR